MVEFLKLLRSGWHTRRQIRAHMGWCEGAVDGWVNELRANGMLRSAPGARIAGFAGPRPTAYTLSPEWGGRDHPLPKDEESIS